MKGSTASIIWTNKSLQNNLGNMTFKKQQQQQMQQNRSIETKWQM